MKPARELKRALLLAELARVRHVDGVVVELGVFRGHTLAMLAEACPEKECLGFDTFIGMPLSSCSPGDGHVAGDFADTSIRRVAARMPENVHLHAGVFPKSAEGLDVRVCFAHVDFDQYLSTQAAIGWLRPRMAPNGVIVFDDWKKAGCPGVAAAIEEAGLQVWRLSKHQALWRAPKRPSAVERVAA